jgi:hypothetical protein
MGPEEHRGNVMKKLDLLSRVELGTIAFLAGAIVFGTTGVVAFFVIEYLLPENWPTILRYGIAVGGAVLTWLLSQLISRTCCVSMSRQTPRYQISLTRRPRTRKRMSSKLSPAFSRR